MDNQKGKVVRPHGCVLRRKEGQQLRLTTAAGEVIWITLDRCRTTGASIVVDAPPTVRIERGEIVQEAAAA